MVGSAAGRAGEGESSQGSLSQSEEEVEGGSTGPRREGSRLSNETFSRSQAALLNGPAMRV